MVALEKRKASFKDAYSTYLDKREHYRSVIETFDDDIHILSKIPVLPVLIDDYDSGNETSAIQSNGPSNGKAAAASSVKGTVHDF